MKKHSLILVLLCLFIGINGNHAATALTLSAEQFTESATIEQASSDALFDAYIEALLPMAHKPSMAACIIHDDAVVWSKGYGYYDLENKKPTNEDILYLQASISKTVTATALMQLYDKGLFDLDDDINDYLPFELRNPNHPDIPITIKMVLSHRSSLALDNFYWVALSYLPGDPDVAGFPYPWLKEYLIPGGSAYSSSTWSEYQPGEKYLYANIGFSIIAYLVEILSNQNFNEYCKEHIFEPLEMHNSSFRLRDHDIDTIAVPYEHKNGVYFRHPHYGIHILYPAVTLRTSIAEFSHFIIAHMNGGVWNGVRILNESTVDLMHTAHFSPDDFINYGLGWQIANPLIRKNRYEHSGGYVGASTFATIIPDDNIAIVLFTNEMDSELMPTISEMLPFLEIFRMLYRKSLQLSH
jgi:CubicO group peptidase (beta-lactamase class C family)